MIVCGEGYGKDFEWWVSIKVVVGEGGEVEWWVGRIIVVFVGEGGDGDYWVSRIIVVFVGERERMLSGGWVEIVV